MMPAVLDLFVSVDVEHDGPIPGTDAYSMLSIGACTPGYRDHLGDIRRISRAEQMEFYRELAPISHRWDPEALAVSGLDRDYLLQHGADPAVAMHELAEAITDACARFRPEFKVRPVFCAYPLGSDWMFTYWYLMHFTGSSPFGHSTHLDMKTLYLTKAGCGITDAVKRRMPAHLLGAGPHTHHALDDAREQGDMLMKLLAWDGGLLGGVDGRETSR
jgi:hypothetical protein